MRLRWFTVPLLLTTGVGYLLFFFGLPLFLALLGGFEIYNAGDAVAFDWQRASVEPYRELFSTRQYREGLYFTLYIATTSTLVSLLISLPLAALLQQNFVGKKVFNAIYKVPLVVPSIVAAFLVLTMMDRGGIAPRLAERVSLELPKMVRDRWAIGVLLAMVWKSIPFMTLIIGGSMSGINRDILLAARTLGAKPLIVFWRVQVPLALPGISAATLLVFIGGMGAFAVPNLLGPIYPLPLSVHMYDNAFEFNEWGLVSAMGTLISVVSSVVLLLYYRLTHRAQRVFQGER